MRGHLTPSAPFPKSRHRRKIRIILRRRLNRAISLISRRTRRHRHARSFANSSAKRISLCIKRNGKLGLNSPFKITGIFTSKTPQRAMLDCSTSTNFSSATPDPVTSASASEKASTCSAKIIFVASFTVCPAPFGPNKKNRFPTA